MTPGRYSLGGVDLPADAIITAGDGVTLQRSLMRAVGSTTWEVQGDSAPVPAELVIEFTVLGTSEADAASQTSIWWQLANSAPSLDREGRSRPLLGAKSISAQHQPGDGWDQKITLTLLPAGPYWSGSSIF